MMKKNAQTRKREWQTLFSAPTSQILELEGLSLPPHLADYEDMLSWQWVTDVKTICPTEGLWVSWPAQLVSCLQSEIWSGSETRKSSAKARLTQRHNPFIPWFCRRNDVVIRVSILMRRNTRYHFYGRKLVGMDLCDSTTERSPRCCRRILNCTSSHLLYCTDERRYRLGTWYDFSHFDYLDASGKNSRPSRGWARDSFGFVHVGECGKTADLLSIF